MGPLETEEFDATQYPPEHVTVGLDEGIQSICERVEDGWVLSPNVVLVIPRGAQAFHNTHDFLALGKLPGARQVRVSIASPDPTIAGLARVLGFHIVDVPADHPALTQDPTLGLSSEDDIEKPTSPLPLGIGLGRWGTSNDWIITEGQQAAPTPKRDSLTTSTWLSNPEDYEAPITDQSLNAPDEGRRTKDEIQKAEGSAENPKSVVPPRTRPRQTSQLSSSSLDSTALHPASAEEQGDPSRRIPRRQFHAPQVSPTPSGRIKARSIMVPDETRIDNRKLRYGSDLDKSFRWGRLFAAVFLLLVAGLVGGAYYAFTYLPEATIAVTPLERDVTVPVGLTVYTTDTAGSSKPGVSLVARNPASPITDLSATLVKASITEEGTRPSTGTRQVPRGKAQGTMHFTNRLDTPVTISSGMKFTAPNGVVIQTAQSGTLKATVFGQSFGTLDLPIIATVEGPDGNIAEGRISGVSGGRFEYYNSALQGGSIETFKILTQEDIDALEAELRIQVEGKVNSAIRELVPPGQDNVLIPQTVQLASVVPTYSHKAGDVADAVHITLNAEARAYTYSETDVRAAVTKVAYDWVGTNISGTVGPVLDPNSLQYTPLSVQSYDPAAGKVVYSTESTGQVTFTLTNELARQIRDLVKGKETVKARNLITEKYGSYVNALSVQARVLWLTVDKLPTDPARISVETRIGPGVYPSGGATLPLPAQGTPDPRSGRP